MARRLLATTIAAGLFLAAVTPVAARDNRHDIEHRANAYVVTNLVSDGSIDAVHTDAHLVNGWGIAAGPTTPWWVSNNGTGTSTLYDANGVARSLVVTVPGAPTGVVFNPTGDFPVTGGGATAPAKFLFASEDGTISGWNANVPAQVAPNVSNQAFVVKNLSSEDAIFKGLTIATFNGASYLYATDFHNGRVDVFDGSLTLQHWAGAFVDRRIPSGFAPFGIAAIGGRIFVTYAKQDADREDDVAGVGLGFVDVFSTNGMLLRRVATRGLLNAPWGVAMAPASFGRFGGDLLVGNFGDGRIGAYRIDDGHWELDGLLRGTNNRPVTIDGLWGIGFGNGSAAGATNVLYFAAGPGDEKHGLFGSISVAAH